MTNIEKLMILWENRPRRRIDYNSEEDRIWCNEFLVAFKAVAPQIKLLAEINAENAIKLISPRIVASIKAITTPAPAPSGSPSPSTGALPVLPEASSTRTQAENPTTGDSDEASDRKSGTSDKPLTGIARLNAARKAAAAAKRLRSAPPAQASVADPGGAPPPATPQPTA